MSNPTWIALASLGVAATSLGIALAALGVAGYGIRRANKTAAAATLVNLNEGLRQAWGRFLSAQGDTKRDELAELLNLLEVACAICLDGSLSGNSGTLMSEYLDGALRLLVNDNYTNAQVPALLQSKTTLIFIRKFLKENAASLSVTVPPSWWQR